MFVKCGSAASGERHEDALSILRPLLESFHELSTDSGATEGSITSSSSTQAVGPPA